MCVTDAGNTLGREFCSLSSMASKTIIAVVKVTSPDERFNVTNVTVTTSRAAPIVELSAGPARAHTVTTTNLQVPVNVMLSVPNPTEPLGVSRIVGIHGT